MPEGTLKGHFVILFRTCVYESCFVSLVFWVLTNLGRQQARTQRHKDKATRKSAYLQIYDCLCLNSFRCAAFVATVHQHYTRHTDAHFITFEEPLCVGTLVTLTDKHLLSGVSDNLPSLCKIPGDTIESQNVTRKAITNSQMHQQCKCILMSVLFCFFPPIIHSTVVWNVPTDS